MFLSVIVVGIDLSGVDHRPTGFCIMNENFEISTKLLFKDEEIISEVARIKPDLITIDAPLSLPKGRASLDERSSSHLRNCDRELIKMKIKIFPLTLGPMRKLTTRGIKLKELFSKMGFRVIEVYPGAAQDILGIPRKTQSITELKAGLERIGIKGIKENVTHHELDAITCAYVGIQYLLGKFIALGDENEGIIIVPKPVHGSK
ncbi:MAG: DUF429 domain-containing protein [Thermoproteota archaeon]|jgi:Uncharacterized conserved protein